MKHETLISDQNARRGAGKFWMAARHRPPPRDHVSQQKNDTRRMTRHINTMDRQGSLLHLLAHDLAGSGNLRAFSNTESSCGTARCRDGGR